MQDIQVVLPDSIGNLQLPDPALVSYYQDLGARRIWLNSEVNQDSISTLCQYIIQWNQEDKMIEPNLRRPIIVIFDSPGGNLEYYEMAKDIFNLSQTQIIGINVSYAASAAGLLFLYCHKKYALPSSSFLYHYGSIQLTGDAKNVIEIIKVYEQEVDEFVDIICEHSDYEPEYVKEKMMLDWEIDADEALEHHIIDGYVDDLSLFWGE